MEGVEDKALWQGIQNELSHCAGTHLRTAARATTRLYDETLAPSGVRITQLSMLAAIAFYGPFTMKALARTLVMERTTLTADLKPLESRSLVSINAGADRRTRIVQITPQGLEAIRHALPLWREAQERITAHFGTAKLQALLGELREVVQRSSI